MADRTHGAMPGPSEGGIFEAFARRIEGLEAEVRSLQARSAQQLPGDWRFVLGEDGVVRIRRVSTGEECVLCGTPVGTCTVRVTAEIDTSDPAQWCVRIRVPEGADRLSLATKWGRLPEGVCAPRPDAPPPDDPGWIYAGSGPPSIITGDDVCSAYGVGSCAFGRYVFAGQLGGEVSLLGYLAPSEMSAGDPGPSAFSFDGGATWGTSVSAEIQVPCITPTA